jgi:hypothetical protein
VRIRSVKPEFWESESNSKMSRDHRLLFIGLFNVADDEGRFRAAIPFLAAQLFPFDEDAQKVVAEGLNELARLDKVTLYRVEGCSYGVVTNFNSHQKLDTRRISKIPSPPIRKGKSPTVAPKNSDGAPENPDAAPKNDVGREGKGREQGREQGAGKGDGQPPTPPPPTPLPDAELITPTNAEAFLLKFLEWVKDRRQLARLEPDCAAPAPEWWASLAKRETVPFARVRAGYNLFLRDKYWGEGKKPAWPITGFASQVDVYLAREPKRVATR